MRPRFSRARVSLLPPSPRTGSEPPRPLPLGVAPPPREPPRALPSTPRREQGKGLPISYLTTPPSEPPSPRAAQVAALLAAEPPSREPPRVVETVRPVEPLRVMEPLRAVEPPRSEGLPSAPSPLSFVVASTWPEPPELAAHEQEDPLAVLRDWARRLSLEREQRGE
jgi:hypothetical protein